MGWPHMTAYILAALGALGLCMMIPAAVLIALQGGWRRAIQQQIAQGRWPMARRLLLIGAALALLFSVGVFVLGLIPGGIPWRK